MPSQYFRFDYPPEMDKIDVSYFNHNLYQDFSRFEVKAVEIEPPNTNETKNTSTNKQRMPLLCHNCGKVLSQKEDEPLCGKCDMEMERL